MASLRRLTALRLLDLDCTGSWHGLAALSRLEHLSLYAGGDLEAPPCFPGLPAAMSTLTALTFLGIETSDDGPPPVEPIRCQHLLPLSLLQHLRLINVADSADVAAALPVFTALTQLCCVVCLLGIPAAVDWQHLCALTALQELSLSACAGCQRRCHGSLG